MAGRCAGRYVRWAEIANYEIQQNAGQATSSEQLRGFDVYYLVACYVERGTSDRDEAVVHTKDQGPAVVHDRGRIRERMYL